MSKFPLFLLLSLLLLSLYVTHSVSATSYSVTTYFNTPNCASGSIVGFEAARATCTVTTGACTAIASDASLQNTCVSSRPDIPGLNILD
jgi:hypothetical protein